MGGTLAVTGVATFTAASVHTAGLTATTGNLTASAGRISVTVNSGNNDSAVILQGNANFAGVHGIIYTSGNTFNDTGHQFFQYNEAGPTLRIEGRSNGGIANYSGNNVNLSSMEAKEAFEPVVNVWDKVTAVRRSIQFFQYKDASNKSDESSWCCSPMAEDIEIHFPEYVVAFSEDKETGAVLKGVREQPLIWELLANLIDEVAALKGST